MKARERASEQAQTCQNFSPIFPLLVWNVKLTSNLPEKSAMAFGSEFCLFSFFWRVCDKQVSARQMNSMNTHTRTLPSNQTFHFAIYPRHSFIMKCSKLARRTWSLDSWLPILPPSNHNNVSGCHIIAVIHNHHHSWG